MTAKKAKSSRNDSDARTLRPVAQSAGKPVGDRWAVIVGISLYQHPEMKELEFADRDAKDLCELLQTSRGGRFASDHIRKLINQDATYMAMNQALRTFLKEPKPEDLVLLYFACHGAPDPRRTDNVYLLTYDTDPDDISGTALPMEAIQDALHKTLVAERVVIIADTCHSGALGGGIGRPRGGINDAEIVNTYLRNMGQARKGVALLTATAANKVAYEGERWEKGHGVFTYCLLEGLKGGADDGTGVIRVGNLFDYVRNRVIEETGGLQRPVIGTDAYDPNLPLAVIGDITVQEHKDLGYCLYEMGRQLLDKVCFDSAVRHLDQASRLSNELFNVQQPDALRQKGLALVALGRYTEAVDAFQQAKACGGEAGADAHFHLVMAQAKRGEVEAALHAADEFISRYHDDVRSGWLEEYRSGCMRALLIGIGLYQDDDIGPSGDVAGDIRMLDELLHAGYGLRDETRKILLDRDATRHSILSALDDLRRASQSGDQVVVYFTGRTEITDRETYLLPADTETDRHPGGISVQELYDMVRLIPAYVKTLIIEAETSSHLVDRFTAECGYHLCLAAQPGDRPLTRQFADSRHGVFSYALVQALRDAPDALLSDLTRRVQELMRKYAEPSSQTPAFLGDETQPLFWRHYDKPYLDDYDLSLRRVFHNLTVDELQERAGRLTTHSFNTLPCALARGLVEKEAYDEAIQVLDRSVSKTGTEAEGTLLLALAQLGAQRYAEAGVALRRYVTIRPEHEERLTPSLKRVEALQTQNVHALVVGVSRYASREISWTRGISQDVEAVRALLSDPSYLDIPAENIEVLLDVQATECEIQSAFSELAKKAREGPALFYYAGTGSLTLDGQPTILSYDARMGPIPNDILLTDLAQIAGGPATNLVAIVDCGWRPGLRVPWSAAWSSRFAPSDARARPTSRSLRSPSQEPEWIPDPSWSAHRVQAGKRLARFQIGRVTIYPAAIHGALSGELDGSNEAIIETELPSPFNTNRKVTHGVLTWALVSSLLETRVKDLTYRMLRMKTGQKLKWLQPVLLCVREDERFLSNAVDEEKIRTSIREEIEREPIHRAVELLKQQIGRQEEKDPQGWLDLGIAYAALGKEKYAEGLRALAEAQRLGLDSSSLHYYLGRLRYESGGDLDDAIADLRAAVHADPDNPGAQYYFGQALRDSIEQPQKWQEVEAAWREYQRLGAPLGHRQEIDDALTRLRSSSHR